MLVIDDRQLQAAVLAVRLADRQVRKVVRAETTAAFRQPWKANIRQAAQTQARRFPALPTMLRAGVTFTAGNPPEGVAYASTRPLRGGLVPAQRYEGAEMGTSRRLFITRDYWSTSPKGRRFRVRERHTARQMPPENDSGWVLYPTVRKMAPQVVTFWVASIVRAYRQALEGGN